jgi:hypothetical protein
MKAVVQQTPLVKALEKPRPWGSERLDSARTADEDLHPRSKNVFCSYGRVD